MFWFSCTSRLELIFVLGEGYVGTGFGSVVELFMGSVRRVTLEHVWFKLDRLKLH